jgi:hypothetical protein
MWCYEQQRFVTANITNFLNETSYKILVHIAWLIVNLLVSWIVGATVISDTANFAMRKITD